MAGSVWDGAVWIPSKVWYVWDGAAWVRATCVYVWDGAAWQEVFCIADGEHSASETAYLLDKATLDKRDREQFYEADETVYVLDRATLDIISRNVTKGPFHEFIAASEQVSLFKQITLGETVYVLDRATLTKVSRIAIKGPFHELVAASESLIVSGKEITLGETVYALDRASLTKVSRTVDITAHELVLATEALTVSEVPELASASIDAALDVTSSSARCRYATGINCLSVRIESSVNGAAYSHLENVNTSESTGGYTSSYVTGLVTDDTINFRVTPYNAVGGAGGSGDSGTAIITNEVTISEE